MPTTAAASPNQLKVPLEGSEVSGSRLRVSSSDKVRISCPTSFSAGRDGLPQDLHRQVGVPLCPWAREARSARRSPRKPVKQKPKYGKSDRPLVSLTVVTICAIHLWYLCHTSLVRRKRQCLASVSISDHAGTSQPVQDQQVWPETVGLSHWLPEYCLA